MLVKVLRLSDGTFIVKVGDDSHRVKLLLVDERDVEMTRGDKWSTIYLDAVEVTIEGEVASIRTEVFFRGVLEEPGW